MDGSSSLGTALFNLNTVVCSSPLMWPSVCYRGICYPPRLLATFTNLILLHILQVQAFPSATIGSFTSLSAILYLGIGTFQSLL
ncbi:hypothetical protein GDO78_004150 [Eleutherodactylus coqui]|uniref:Uncharacterized protein n=1 Tax=Eleutherodactylus coqui TaxID=57060 RepID=A0A8J6JZC6_ELECQ|nr:hypothetical protein GDO78_004150 [Eleutherodactylus coqui]